MPAEVKLLIDEDTHLALAEALRKRGYDAVHVREVERRGLGDPDQLDFASAQGSLLCDLQPGRICCFAWKYTLAGREHCGIIVSEQKPIGQMLREMLTFLETHSAEDVRGQIFSLKP